MEVVRIGQFGRIAENTRYLGLDEKITKTAFYKDIKELNIKLKMKYKKLKKKVPRFVKEKREDFNERQVISEKKSLEKLAIDEILRESPIICSTNVGAMDHTL